MSSDQPWRPYGDGNSTATPLSEPFVLTSSAEAIPLARTKEDLKDGPGSLATAIVAPKSGDIPVEPGTPVVLIAKRLRESATFKKLWRAICLAWAAFWSFVIIQVLIAGGPFKLTEQQWLDLLKDATYPALASVALAYGIKAKVGDNDPIVNASLSKGAKP